MEKSVQPKSSKVWEFFTLNTVKKTVSCKTCSIDLAWHGSTTSLREPLKRKHVGSMDEEKNSRKKQASIRDLVQRKVYTPQQGAALTDSVLNMLVTDMRPLSMVEDDGFRKMIYVLNPGYTLPSRTHFTKLMERKYEQTFQAV
ncbi:zinc finger BED domain-containing protein 4-like [Nerophis ophidion]|uniref:zinc finger BED domain-containing protein 4-like n=1 Tax=Nerophis ophidion TaxID=159077 RepID=UPI002ADF5904|nr:zinc finger BED domain-containing protein 4-like [Nerophis ophidion]